MFENFVEKRNKRKPNLEFAYAIIRAPALVSMIILIPCQTSLTFAL